MASSYEQRDSRSHTPSPLSVVLTHDDKTKTAAPLTLTRSSHVQQQQSESIRSGRRVQQQQQQQQYHPYWQPRSEARLPSDQSVVATTSSETLAELCSTNLNLARAQSGEGSVRQAAADASVGEPSPARLTQHRSHVHDSSTSSQQKSRLVSAKQQAQHGEYFWISPTVARSNGHEVGSYTSRHSYNCVYAFFIHVFSLNVACSVDNESVVTSAYYDIHFRRIS